MLEQVPNPSMKEEKSVFRKKCEWLEEHRDKLQECDNHLDNL